MESVNDANQTPNISSNLALRITVFGILLRMAGVGILLRMAGVGILLNGFVTLMSYFKIRFNPGYAKTPIMKKTATSICSHCMLNRGTFCDIKDVIWLIISGDKKK